MSTNIIMEPGINNDNNNDNNAETKVKRTRNRLTKKQQFVKEREQIIAKLNNILGVNDKNNTFYLYDIINSEDIKNKIHELSEEVKKYFKCGSWHYYKANNNNEEAQEIGLIRAIYRDEGLMLTKKDISLKLKENRVRTTQYYIFKNTN